MPDDKKIISYADKLKRNVLYTTYVSKEEIKAAIPQINKDLIGRLFSLQKYKKAPLEQNEKNTDNGINNMLFIFPLMLIY